MKLAALIQKGGLQRVATATLATVATEGTEQARTVARVATVAVAEARTAARDAPDFLPDAAAEGRRQRVLTMLAERPGVRYAAITDALAVPGSVMLTLAVRHVGTVELLIPAEKWDGVLFLDLIERHSATVH